MEITGMMGLMLEASEVNAQLITWSFMGTVK